MNNRHLAKGMASLLFITGAIIAAIRFESLQSPPANTLSNLAPAPPLDPTEAWTQVDNPESNRDIRQILQAHRALAQNMATEPPTGASLQALLDLAPYGVDPRLRESLTVSLQLSAVQVAVLLETPIGTAIMSRCHSAQLEMMCDESWRTEQQLALLDRLAELLGSEDDVLASRALDQVCLMGPVAQSCAETALAAESLRSRAVGLIAAGCVMEEKAAVELMQQHLDPADPLAPIAALELGRLGQGTESLESLKREHAGTPLSLFAAYGIATSKINTQARSSP